VKLSLVILFSFLLLAASDQPQQTAPTYLESLEVTVSTLDVVVTDKAGHTVPGLRAADFEVRENGVPRPISNFAAYGTSSGSAELKAPRPTAAAPSAPASVQQEAPPPRKFVFYVDEMSIHPQSRAKLASLAHEMVETAMRPGDEAMIVTPAETTKGTLAFSSDRAAVDKRLQTEIERSVHRADTPSRAEQFYYDHVVGKARSRDERQQMVRVYATRVNRRVTSTLRALLGIVGSLTETSGKKVLVVISESLVAEPGREATSLGEMQGFTEAAQPDMFSSSGSDRQPTAFEPNTSKWVYYDARPMIAELGARASANGITIYSIQPDPGFTINSPGPAAESGAPKATPLMIVLGTPMRPTAQQSLGGGFGVTPFQREIAEGTAETLGSLADATGGKYWRGEGELPDAFRTIATDIDSYYSIGYRVPEGSSNQLRHVDVTVKGRPDLVVRTRRDVLRYSPEREMDEIAAATLLTAKKVNELDISAVAGQPKKRLDSYDIDVAVKIPLSKLTFIPEGDKYRAQFSVHYAVADGANYTTGQMRQQILQVPAADIDAVRTKTYTYKSTLVVAPGTARITVGVFDTLSRLSGFQRVSVVAR